MTLKIKRGKMQIKTLREKLVDAILDLSGDEFGYLEDVKTLAKESESELVERVIHIAEQFKANNW